MADNFDIAFSFDTTGSMYSCLEEVRKRLAEMVQELNRKIPSMRIAIFAHGDYCDDHPSSYVTKHVDFTLDSSKLSQFVRDVSKTSGGDWPECYELVMRQVQERLNWNNNSQKALVLIGDAIPHDKDEEQNNRHLDWKEEVVRLRDRGIKIYAVQCNFDTDAEDFYQFIASKSFGYYMKLDTFEEVKELLMSICFREAGLGMDSESSPESVLAGVRPTSPQAAESSDESDSDNDEEETDMRLTCTKCVTKKPPNEFPTTPVSERCEHYPSVCYRCVVNHVSKRSECPQTGCNVKVDDPGSKLTVEIFQAILDSMFINYAEVYEANRKALLASKGNVITVSSVTGDTCWIDYNPSMTIQQIKQAVRRELGIEENQQKIFFGEKHLKVNKAPGQPFTLTDHRISQNDSLNVIVPLYCIPEDLDHVVFDLSWEFPKSKVDFLDASCLVFEGTEFVQVIDWNHAENEYYLKGSIKHTAKNVTTSGGRVGHQSIHVHLKKVPSNMTHLYFTLSSWRAPTLASFSNPRLQFYEASKPETNLCGTTFSHALRSQAVIMCSVVREKSGWQIFECDSSGCVNGNAKLYNPLRKRIAEMISEE